MITILDPGLAATVQDRGRPGWAHLGVPHAGAADPGALDLGNRLLGNESSAAGIEFLLGGFTVRFDDAAAFALTGAVGPAALDGRPVAAGTWCYARSGQHLAVGRPVQGLRSYLCVAGGVDVEPVLGSRSTDTLSGLGPAPLTAGEVVPLGPPPRGPGAPADSLALVEAGEPTAVDVRWGPRQDWFTASACERLVSARWRVSAELDRTGVRLLGPALDHATEQQLPTEGMMAGAIQVPASGQPIVLLANHAPTGGYPVIAVVTAADLCVIAQMTPGQWLRFSAHG